MLHALRSWLAIFFGVLIADVVRASEAGLGEASPTPPNVVVIFADDLGYADLSCQGARGYSTPNIDRLADEGIRFTDFYVAQAVCSASRTALLTGCYPNRVGILGALGPKQKIGIHADETLLSEVLKSRGYATAIFGKWHLGHHEPFLPPNHGFDEFFGLPYSNDMWPNHPTDKSFPPLPLMEVTRVLELNPDQRKLTTTYTERAVDFINRNRDKPFFLYVPHSMPHVPLYVSDKFEWRSERGLFGDVVTEIDWSVGEIVEALARHGLTERTIVLFSSDNGPWLSYGDHAGSAHPLREGKGTTFDGGVRTPFLARWPGKIPAGSVCKEPVMSIDILPTIAKLAGATVSTDRPIDGQDISPLLFAQPAAHSPHEALYFYWDGHLQAVRSGRWKLHFPHVYRSLEGSGGSGGQPSQYTERMIDLSLFDVESDPGETMNVAGQNPDVVEYLQRLAEVAREELGDTTTNRIGKSVRAPGSLE
jgi:arylsulfatase A